LIDLGAIPAGLKHIVQRATRQVPDERYQSLGELLDAVSMYRRSKDPNQNPRETFENLVQAAKQDLSAGQYDAETVRAMLALLTHTDKIGPDAVIELFDTIPLQLLGIMVSDFAGEFEPALNRYADAIDEKVAGYQFDYAERVAKRMKIVFTQTGDPSAKAAALGAILVAAVKLNRYAAMDVFDALLRSVKATEDAIPIAEMLQKHSTHYRALANRIPADALCRAIRDVREAVLANPSPY
jgi:hypothetical protein